LPERLTGLASGARGDVVSAVGQELNGAPAAPGLMRGRVLVLDGDARARAALVKALTAEGLAVDGAADGARVPDALRGGRYELAIVDIAAPGLCGLEGCRRIRFESDVPLLIVTARDSEADRVLGLEAGADDYIGKPFSPAELISRVRAILRRRQLDRGPLRSRLRVGDIEIDLVRQRVTVRGEPVCLTPTEFRLLVLLAQTPGHAFSARAILHHLWQTDFVGDANACKAHVFNLRRKIEEDGAAPTRLVTVSGAGYALQG
jgi:DNA-binding response OmpR family regulator